ncbi:MAG: malate dehydrogenase, partial [Gammaproteobacteria bacterium]|nr:malate dehydrogenase [Gammaproteobacteria bacterium]
GIIYSLPVTCNNGAYTVVKDLEINDFSREKMRLTDQELREERDAIKDLL